jgi:hypothetical protein
MMITGKLDRRSHCHLPYMALFKSYLIIQSFLLQRGICVPKNRRVMEFRAIKITGLVGKIGLVAEHSKPVQSRK